MMCMMMDRGTYCVVIAMIVLSGIVHWTEGQDPAIAECYMEGLGRDYRGYVSTTMSGKTCQVWTAQTPHSHSRSPSDEPAKGLGEHNYCRNPDSTPPGVWCYTTDPGSRYEFCDIGTPSLVSCTVASVSCTSQPLYPNVGYCYVEEGEAALIRGDLLLHFGLFNNAVLTTAPLPGPISGVDDATPTLDFAPITIESEFSFSAKIELVDDCDVENDEAFVLDITPLGSVLTDQSIMNNNGGVVIKDNDDNYRIEKEHYDVMESDEKFEFMVTRTGVLAEYLLEYSTCDITAQSGSDFLAVTQGSIYFADGAPSAMGTVDIVTDQDTEVTEVFAINIVYNNPPEVTSGCRGKVIPPSRAYVTIHDSADASKTYYWIEESRYSVIEPGSGTTPFTFTVRREGNTAVPSTIELAIRAVSASAGFDYEASLTSVTFDANKDDAGATVNIIADSTTESPETFEVSIADPSIRKVSSYHKAVVTIQDVATTKSCIRFDMPVYVALELSQQVTLTLQREGNLNSAGNIRIVTEDVDASSIQDLDYVSKTIDISFSANQQQKEVIIPITDDMIKEDTECFKVKLQKIDTLNVCTQEAQVLIKDDDDEFSFEGTVFRVHEDRGTIDVYIERTGYLGKQSSVRVQNVAGSFPNSATIGADFSLPSATTIQFAANQRRLPVTIRITSENPALFEGEEDVTLMLAPSTPFLQDQIGVPHEATIVIVDKDCPADYCSNGGTCLEAGNINYCQCPEGFIGDTCMTPVVRPDDAADDSATDDGLSGGAIAGIVLGSLAGILGIGLIVICLCVMLRNGQNQPQFGAQIQQQQFDLRPYSGANQAYAMSSGVMGVPPLY